MVKLVSSKGAMSAASSPLSREALPPQRSSAQDPTGTAKDSSKQGVGDYLSKIGKNAWASLIRSGASSSSAARARGSVREPRTSGFPAASPETFPREVSEFSEGNNALIPPLLPAVIRNRNVLVRHSGKQPATLDKVPSVQPEIPIVQLPREPIDFSELATKLMFADTREKLAEVKAHLERSDFDPEAYYKVLDDGREASLLGELLEHLADPRRPDLSGFSEGRMREQRMKERQMRGEEEEEPVEDWERLDILKHYDPFESECTNGLPPALFAYEKKMDDFFRIFSTSNNEKVQKCIEEDGSLFESCKKQWKLHINQQIHDFAKDNPSNKVLQHFKSFIHTQDSVVKGRIAKEVAGEQERLFRIYASGLESHRATPVKSVFSHFALASMVSHYLLSEEKEKGGLSVLCKEPPFFEPYPATLDKINFCLGECIRAVRSSYFDQESELAQYAKYSESDRALLTDLAFKSAELLIQLTSQDVVDQLGKGESQATCDAISSWAQHVRSDLHRYTHAPASGCGGQDFIALLKQFAEDCKNVLDYVSDDERENE